MFAQYENPDIPQNDIVEKLRQAAHCIYKITEYQLVKKWLIDNDENAYIQLQNQISQSEENLVNYYYICC